MVLDLSPGTGEAGVNFCARAGATQDLLYPAVPTLA